MISNFQMLVFQCHRDKQETVPVWAVWLCSRCLWGFSKQGFCFQNQCEYKAMGSLQFKLMLMVEHSSLCTQNQWKCQSQCVVREGRKTFLNYVHMYNASMFTSINQTPRVACTDNIGNCFVGYIVLSDVISALTLYCQSWQRTIKCSFNVDIVWLNVASY